jgi:ankyrin repeat protein
MSSRLTKIDANRFVDSAGLGEAAVVRYYLGRGMSPDAVDKDGLSALAAAAQKQQLQMLKLLLDSGANPSLAVKPTSASGFLRTALHEAIAVCDPSAIDLLLSRGANPCVLDGARATAAHMLAFSWPTLKGSSEGESFLLQTLGSMLEKGVRINQVDATRQTILGKALEVKTPIPVLEWLLDRGASVDGVAALGRSALHMAVKGGYLEAIPLLVRAGCKINGTDELGRTPIFEQWPSADICTLLLEHGADLEHQDLDGRTPLAVALAAHPRQGVNERTADLINAGARLDAADFQRVTPRALIASRKLTEVDAFIKAAAARHAMRMVARQAPTATLN